MSSIYEADFLATLPPVLKNDTTILAIASAAAAELVGLLDEVPAPVIYARIGELPEILLDLLAYDFKVDWYDQSYDVATKRALIADNVKVHKRLGTKWAVRRVVETYFGEGALWEWFEYGGDPFHFLIVSTTDISGETYNQFIKLLNIVKNARSVLDDVVVALPGTWNYFDFMINKTWDEWAALDLTWAEFEAYEE
jgi:phage tail P2-like protein